MARISHPQISSGATNVEQRVDEVLATIGDAPDRVTATLAFANSIASVCNHSHRHEFETPFAADEHAE